MKFNPKWFKLFGLLLDIIGTIIIGIGVLNMNTHFTRLHKQEELEEDLETQLKQENKFTIIGISLLCAGFMLIFGEELYSSVWKKSTINN